MSLSDLSPIEEWLKNFTYREGYEIEYFPPTEVRDRLSDEMLRMHDGRIVIRTPDSRMAGATSRGRFLFPIALELFSGPNGEEQFKRWFRKQVQHVELHEWLLYKGVREWDPHASNYR